MTLEEAKTIINEWEVPERIKLATIAVFDDMNRSNSLEIRLAATHMVRVIDLGNKDAQKDKA